MIKYEDRKTGQTEKRRREDRGRDVQESATSSKLKNDLKMCWRKIVDLLRLCNTPASIISPIPFLAISLFLISRKELYLSDVPILLAGIAVSLFSNFGANLWNHCNDLKEDMAQGKKTILTQDASMQKGAIFISIWLYASSILFVYFLSILLERQIYVFFFIWSLVTWWYSDNLILKKVFGFRLKDHYRGELITYATAWPMYILCIWSVYSELNATGIIIAVAFFFVSISGLLLKDIKDISGDRDAGLKTFGVVFFPSQLIRYSCYLAMMYYLIMLNPITVNFFGTGILLISIPFVYFFKNTFFHMYRKNWTLDIGDFKALKGMSNSVYISIIFMGLSAFL